MPETRHRNGASRIEQTKGGASFMLAKVCKAHRAKVGALLAGHGLHVGQEMVLLELWQEDGLRGGELALRLGVEPPTVTKMLRRLEACGLIERRADPADARSFRIYLTREGRSLEEPVLGCWELNEESVLAGLGDEERKIFRSLLIRVRSNLDPAFGAEK
jgi:DNA-binding MarR family transcriptional regulator